MKYHTPCFRYYNLSKKREESFSINTDQSAYSVFWEKNRKKEHNMRLLTSIQKREDVHPIYVMCLFQYVIKIGNSQHLPKSSKNYQNHYNRIQNQLGHLS